MHGHAQPWPKHVQPLSMKPIVPYKLLYIKTRIACAVVVAAAVVFYRLNFPISSINEIKNL